MAAAPSPENAAEQGGSRGLIELRPLWGGAGGGQGLSPSWEHAAAAGGGVKSSGSASAESGLREEDGALS